MTTYTKEACPYKKDCPYFDHHHDVFVWATATGSPSRIAWLKENYNKPITLEQYIEFERNKPHDHVRASKCKSKAKRRYAYLKSQYSFFTPDARVQ